MTTQIPEQPHEAAQEPQIATLAALVQQARTEAAETTQGGAVATVVQRLTQSEGAAPLAALKAEGYPDQAIAAAAQADPKDRRLKPRIRVGIVSGEPVAWLTTTGWQSAGHPSRRERRPSHESMAHAAAPAALGRWLTATLKPWPYLRVDVVGGPALREWSDQVKALAWAQIQARTSGDTSNVGSLTGGMYPDALLVERWPDPETYTSAWGADPQTPDDVAEQTLGLEIEDTRKSAGLLRSKVDRWDGAISLGAAYGVVWIVRSADVRANLVALGVGDLRRRPRQFLVAGSTCGLGGELLAPHGPEWWPARLAKQQTTRP